LSVDDGSTDESNKIARELDLQIFMRNRNYGYGAYCGTQARGDIIVMVHPHYQYDPVCFTRNYRPIETNQADLVVGSRLLGKSPTTAGNAPW
jgi:glycosyltransferase involved in cell wall biosynthesis